MQFAAEGGLGNAPWPAIPSRYRFTVLRAFLTGVFFRFFAAVFRSPASSRLADFHRRSRS